MHDFCLNTIYFITRLDDYSRYGYMYLLSHRYEALDVFKRFVVGKDSIRT